MVGFEIMVNVPRDKRQEFIQTCDLLSDAAYRNAACVEQALYENVQVANRFVWMEYWSDSEQMDLYLQSNRFNMLLGAISVLGESNRILRLTAQNASDQGCQEET